MSTELQVFNFEGTPLSPCGLDRQGIELWPAAAVCRAMDLSDASQAVGRLDEDEKGTCIVRTLGGDQKVLAVNRFGIYSRVFTSRKPVAKRFKRWLVHEVIPALEKDGYYAMAGRNPPTPTVPQVVEGMSPAVLAQTLKAVWLMAEDHVQVRAEVAVIKSDVDEVKAGQKALASEAEGAKKISWSAYYKARKAREELKGFKEEAKGEIAQAVQAEIGRRFQWKNADKRRAVDALLDDPESSWWSLGRIAKAAGCSASNVRNRKRHREDAARAEREAGPSEDWQG